MTDIKKKENSDISNNKKVKQNKEKWSNVTFEPQPLDDILQLETENDQIGTVIVEHVIRKIKEVFGQPPTDMKKIDWKEYGIHFQNRPSPYEFPAFEHERIKEEHQTKSLLGKEDYRKSKKRDKTYSNIDVNANSLKGK